MAANPNLAFVGRCQVEKYGTIRIGYSKADLKKLTDNLAANGWGNVRVRFTQTDNKPYMVLIPPVAPKDIRKDREPVPEANPVNEPENIEPPEDAEKKKLPF